MSYNKKKKLSYGSIIHGNTKVQYKYRCLENSESLPESRSQLQITSTPKNDEPALNFEELFNENDYAFEEVTAIDEAHENQSENQNETDCDNDRNNDEESSNNSLGSKDSITDFIWFTNQCERSVVRTEDFAFLILFLQRLHNLTDTSINILLKTLTLLLPSNYNRSTTLTSVRNDIRNSNFYAEYGKTEIFYFCEMCKNISDKKCRNTLCPGFISKRKPAEFTTINIENQLKVILSEKGNYVLEYLKSLKGDKYNDIIHNSHYKKIVGENPEKNHLKLHGILNSDGARFPYSRTGECWPILILLVELEPIVRCSYENALCAGIWIGGKPDYKGWKMYLENIIIELKHLKFVGFNMLIGNTTYNVTFEVLATVLDMPARASFWNVKQFNGMFGCMECNHPGTQLLI